MNRAALPISIFFCLHGLMTGKDTNGRVHACFAPAELSFHSMRILVMNVGLALTVDA
jgi:hypothetical protein